MKKVDEQDGFAERERNRKDTKEMKSEDGYIRELALEVLGLAHDDILIHLRFLDTALSAIRFQAQKGRGLSATNGVVCYYDPVRILKEYSSEKHAPAREMLHILLHCIFFHSFQYDKLDEELWDLATDIAVENVILEMRLDSVSLETDPDRMRKLRLLKEDVSALTAEKLYRYFKASPPGPATREEYRELFMRDSHELWVPPEEFVISQEQWEKISERVRADLKSFTRAKNGGEALEKNLEEAVREHYDYSDILRRFAVSGEDLTVNDDEFDYIFYTYGLQLYGNMPLVEALEYKEIHKVREFVIAIDTSASCRGPLVRAFLNKTWNLLKGQEDFFHKVNVHIIQCDHEISSDTKITCDEDLETFMRYGKLKGFGATDFRPVFDYVRELETQGEFENLKGLIYFTDGYGIYPETMPDYEVIFAFLDEDEQAPPVPPWALKVILDSEMLESEAGDDQLMSMRMERKV